ncbi:MAG: glycosyltransferase involved in cell wall biosynthesis [Bacteroidia bacterium]|jgi:glycosyltransferase involved in cell wall biosynthesis
MSSKPIIDVIIPAYNEENAIGLVLDEIPKDLVRRVVVADNNSTDKTTSVAEKHGAIVVFQPKPGYGNACLKAMGFIAQQKVKPDIVVFLDGDYSDYPEQLNEVVAPILDDKADLVIGSRASGNSESGSLTPQQVFGNWLATRLLKLFYGVAFTDLGPFRAIRYKSLLALEMNDPTYGWTVEMQIKAAKQKLRCAEVPVDYRVRIGQSKVSGTVKGTIGAGYKIILTLIKYL